MDGQTDERTDGEGDSYIPPQTLFAGGIIKGYTGVMHDNCGKLIRVFSTSFLR